MQFYLDGFKTGDPAILDAVSAPIKHDRLPEEVDVLIVGCGPAGLALAAQMSAFPHISTAIIEQKDGPLLLGQADGIACRTMEMFEAFGFAHEIEREAYWVNETIFWKPAEDGSGGIIRSARVQDVEDGLSEFPHVILNQARVHDRFLSIMRNSATRAEPFYSRQLLDLETDADISESHPIVARILRIDAKHEGEMETIRARYVVGCDGARSKVRWEIGRELHGDSANQAWGVMDVLAVSDFPDLRFKCAIQSASEGSALIIPREGGYLTRIYIELDKLGEDRRITELNITIEKLMEAAKRIFHPYTLDVKEVAWWSCYEIGQRLCDKFDDVPEGATADRNPRIFIAGDACHTHSPKAGQGMNVSMQDSFNLGWKLASVLSGQSGPELLHTYSAERQDIANELIEFDREWAAMFSAQPKASGDTESDGVDPDEFQRYFIEQGRFTAGTATQYKPSAICGDERWQKLASGLTVGMRFHSAPVVRLADAKPVQLGHVNKADGRWRIFLFAGSADEGMEQSPVAQMCRFLGEDPSSPIVRFTPEAADIDAIFDVRVVFQQGHRELEWDKMPTLLRPHNGRYGLCDYEKVFCAKGQGAEDIYDMRNIDREAGCIVVVRPDQYIAQVLPMDGAADLQAFFEGFFRE